MKKYLFILLIITPLIYFSCAKIGSPTGGPQDTIAPVVVKSFPMDRDTGFSEKEMEIKFDEFFELGEINTEFFSSPPFLEIPDFKIYKKKLIIKFNEELKDTTTYTLYFGNAIKDFNEGNEIENYTFIFSTGSIIDSFSVSGYIYNAATLDKIENVFVMIYKNDYDSIPYIETPYFLTKTDTSGYFFINNIKPGKYKLFSLLDMNTNLLYDMPNESIGFLDTNIFATAKTVEKIDSLKNLKYVYDSLNVNIIDSMYVDSIVESIFYEYSPDNLKIFMFDEDNKKQYVNEAVRAKKGQLIISFSKEIKDSLVIRPLNFDIEFPLFETFEENDSIIYWIDDLTLLDLDTFKIELTYLQIDSLHNYFSEKDTLFLVYDEEDVDSIYMKLETNLTSDFDYYKGIYFETGVPIKKIDTSKIRLFELIDTAVIVDLTQKIEIQQRFSKDFYIFKFTQPLVEFPKIDFMGIEETSEDYILELNDLRDSLTLKIKNSEISDNSKNKFILFYDNSYFFNQYQTFADIIDLKIDKMKIVSKTRNSRDEIVLTFNKNLTTELIIKNINNNLIENWYTAKITGNTAVIKIENSEFVSKDTLLLSLKTFDYTDFENNIIDYTDTLSFIYKENPLKIEKSYRDLSNHIVIEFNKPLKYEPVLNLINSELLYWYRTDFEGSSTKMEYEIFHPGTRSLNEINFTVNFKDSLGDENIEEYMDTLKLKVEKQPLDLADSVYLKIELEKDFVLKKDSSHLRKYILNYEKEFGKEYLLKVDSLAFTDIFNLKNDSLSTIYKLRDVDYYGNLVLNITNLGAMQYNEIEFNKLLKDTLGIDSAIITSTFDKITEGQAILQLLNSNEEVLYEYFLSESQIFKIPNLTPQTFILKIIYDKNINGKWDTGNYLQKIQPEKVFYYSKSTAIQSGFDTEVDWKIESY